MNGFIMKLGKRPAAKPRDTVSPDPNALTIFTDEQLCATNGVDPDTNEGVIEGGAKGTSDTDTDDGVEDNDGDTDQEDDTE
jgi:hypothetical protein